MTAIDEIFEALETRGSDLYGTHRVTQAEHALQCAANAEAAGAPPTLVAAALLHDFGQMLHGLGRDTPLRGIDNRHEIVGADWLAQYYPPAVTEPIRLHVPAKRYLCAAEPGYWDKLSEGSKRSLVVQGGPFSPQQVDEYLALPYAREAARLRQWDDEAKVPGAVTRTFEDYRELLMSVMTTQRSAA